MAESSDLSFIHHFNAPVFNEGIKMYRDSMPIWKKKFDPPKEAIELCQLYADKRDEFVAAFLATQPNTTIVHGMCRKHTV